MLPLFIGLPGCGKSFMAKAFASNNSYSVIETDVLFREYRGISPVALVPEAEVMRLFLARARIDYPDIVLSLEKDATTVNAINICRLADGNLFRGYGEDVFRCFETEMLKWLSKRGVFEGAIVDLSASISLSIENRELFCPKNGFLPILLKTSYEDIVNNVLHDYWVYKCTGKTMRGAYEKALDNLGPKASKKELRECVLKMTRDAAIERMAFYKCHAKRIIAPKTNTSVGELVAIVSNFHELNNI